MCVERVGHKSEWSARVELAGRQCDGIGCWVGGNESKEGVRDGKGE